MKATIVIPIKVSLSSLHRNLKSLALQDQSLIEEIVVVENGSNQVRDLSTYQMNIRVLKLDKGNRSRARNYGARGSEAPFLIFLDADVALEKDWLKNVLMSFEEDTVAIQGAIVPLSQENNLLQRIRKTRIFFSNGNSFLSLKKDQVEKVVINSAAFCIRNSVFKSLNGFDENLYRHEDLDFTQRLLRQEGTIKAINNIKCQVYFDSNLFHYFLREFDCGYQIVRYHERWSSQGLSQSFSTLGNNFLSLIWRLKRSDLSRLNASMKMLEFTYLCGNFAGIIRKIISPYPDGMAKKDPVKAKLVFE